MAIDPVEASRFIEKDRLWRERNRTLVGTNPVLVCAKCGWKISAQDALNSGVHACQQCGSVQCRVHCLDYGKKDVK